MKKTMYPHLWPYREKPEAPKLSGSTSYLLLALEKKFGK